jgi:hypothetical protein
MKRGLPVPFVAALAGAFTAAASAGAANAGVATPTTPWLGLRRCGLRGHGASPADDDTRIPHPG